MTDIDPLAVAVATVAAFLLSGAWYAVLPAPPAASEAGDPPGTETSPPVLLAEILRSAVVVIVVAGLAAELGSVDIAEGAALGLVLWVGFPAVLFAGSIIHEHYPRRLAAIHLGDWLLKLALIGAIIGAVQ
jgi:Protein of unknown function (DUF1761)